NFQVGETVQFQVVRTDGVPDHPPGNLPWRVTDGLGGFTPYQDQGGMWWDPDPDGLANGTFRTTGYVSSQYAGAALQLSATGQSSGETTTVRFTDGNVKANISSPISNDSFTLTSTRYDQNGAQLGSPITQSISTNTLISGSSATFVRLEAA